MYVWRDFRLHVHLELTVLYLCMEITLYIWFTWIILFRNLEAILYDRHGYRYNCLMLLFSKHNWFTVPCMVEMVTIK